MPDFKIGRFTVQITLPYPAWITISHEAFPGTEIGRFHHSELRDLKYAIERAERDVKLLLRADAKEV